MTDAIMVQAKDIRSGDFIPGVRMRVTYAETFHNVRHLTMAVMTNWAALKLQHPDDWWVHAPAFDRDDGHCLTMRETHWMWIVRDEFSRQVQASIQAGERYQAERSA